MLYLLRQRHSGKHAIDRNATKNAHRAANAVRAMTGTAIVVAMASANHSAMVNVTHKADSRRKRARTAGVTSANVGMASSVARRRPRGNATRSSRRARATAKATKRRGATIVGATAGPVHPGTRHRATQMQRRAAR